MSSNIFLIIAVVTTGIFVIQFILSIFFGDIDADVDVDADIISMVENSPTYQRDKSTLAAIKVKAEEAGILATEEAREAESGGNGIITF